MTRHSIIPSVNLILERDNKVLLMRRFNTGFANGMYCTPGGHLEPGETLSEGLIRETLEEVGIKIYDIALKSVVNQRKLNRVHFYFYAKSDDEPKNMEPHKCDDLAWFDKSDLPKNMVEGITDIILGKDYIELD